MFEGHFCNPQSPNEKGRVEGLVGVIRRNVFVPVPQVEFIEELNGPILNWCHKDLDRSHPDGEGTVKDCLDKEKERLFPLPKRRYQCCRTQEAIVNKFSEVKFDYNLYSVPIKYANKCVTIKGYVDKVKIVKDDGTIAEHRRSYARNQEILEPLHYIPILKRKPQVLKHGKPFKDWRLPRIFEEYRRILKEREDRPEKEYIRLLSIMLSSTLIDELGYIPLSKSGAQLLFGIFAERYEQSSIMVTTNLEFGEWTKVFGDKKLTSALLDRLTHRCEIFLMNGESYRFRESQRRLKKKRLG